MDDRWYLAELPQQGLNEQDDNIWINIQSCTEVCQAQGKSCDDADQFPHSSPEETDEDGVTNYLEPTGPQHWTTLSMPPQSASWREPQGLPPIQPEEQANYSIGLILAEEYPELAEQPATIRNIGLYDSVETPEHPFICTYYGSDPVGPRVVYNTDLDITWCKTYDYERDANLHQNCDFKSENMSTNNRPYRRLCRCRDPIGGQIVCTQPRRTTGYVVTNNVLNADGFDVSVSCAAGYEGEPSVSACSESGPYTLEGCSPIMCELPELEYDGLRTYGGDGNLTMGENFSLTSICSRDPGVATPLQLTFHESCTADNRIVEVSECELNAGYYYEPSQGMPAACASVENSAADATLTCTSLNDSRVESCNEGYYKIDGNNNLNDISPDRCIPNNSYIDGSTQLITECPTDQVPNSSGDGCEQIPNQCHFNDVNMDAYLINQGVIDTINNNLAEIQYFTVDDVPEILCSEDHETSGGGNQVTHTCPENNEGFVLTECLPIPSEPEQIPNECLGNYGRQAGQCDRVEAESGFETFVESMTGAPSGGYETYRLGIRILDDSNIQNVYAIYSAAGAEMSIPPAFHVATPFGSHTGGVSSLFYGAAPDSEFDSWITVGEVGGDPNDLLSSAGIDFATWDENTPLAVGAPPSGGSVFWMDPADGPGGPDPIVLAQLTVPAGSAGGVTMGVQGRSNIGPEWYGKVEWEYGPLPLDTDCTGTWSACTEECTDATYTVTRVQSGQGSDCEAPDGATRTCDAGDGDCPAVVTVHTALCRADQHVADNNCVACPPGSTHAAGADASGPDTACRAVLCAENEYVAGNNCVACPPGSTHAAGADASGSDTACRADACAADEYVAGNNCVACPPGSTHAAGADASGPDTACTPVVTVHDPNCDVSGVTAPVNGEFGTVCSGEAGRTINHGTECDLTCNEGYTLSNQPSCTDGTLTSTTATCSPITCVLPTTSGLGYDISGMSCSSLTVDRIECETGATCATGYTGQPEYICVENGSELTLMGCSQVPECESNQIVNQENQCMNCPNGQQPNPDSTECIECDSGLTGNDGYCNFCPSNHRWNGLNCEVCQDGKYSPSMEVNDRDNDVWECSLNLCNPILDPSLYPGYEISDHDNSFDIDVECALGYNSVTQPPNIICTRSELETELNDFLPPTGCEETTDQCIGNFNPDFDFYNFYEMNNLTLNVCPINKTVRVDLLNADEEKNIENCCIDRTGFCINNIDTSENYTEYGDNTNGDDKMCPEFHRLDNNYRSTAINGCCIQRNGYCIDNFDSSENYREFEENPDDDDGDWVSMPEKMCGRVYNLTTDTNRNALDGCCDERFDYCIDNWDPSNNITCSHHSRFEDNPNIDRNAMYDFNQEANQDSQLNTFSQCCLEINNRCNSNHNPENNVDCYDYGCLLYTSDAADE